MKNEDMIVRAVARVRRLECAFNLEFKDSRGNTFKYGMKIYSILDRKILACGVWGTVGYCYFDMEDFSSCGDNEKLARLIKNNMEENYGAVEIINKHFKTTRQELIRKIEELDRILVEEVELEELTDYTRSYAHSGFEDIIENVEKNRGCWD